MYKLFIFDMDGTVIDTDLLVVLAWLKMYEKFKPGYIPHLTEMLAFSGPSLQESVTQALPGVDPKEAINYFAKVSTPLYDTSVVTYPGLRDTIAKIHSLGAQTALNTNKLPAQTRHALKVTGLDGLFDYVVAGGDVEEMKPSPLGVKKIMREAEVDDLKEVLYIGDTVYDYKTAENAGVDFMAVTWVPRNLPTWCHPRYHCSGYRSFFDDIK